MKKLIFISLLLFNELFAYDRITGLPFATRSEVIGQNGMAATSHPLATQTAIDVLKSGGNAIDAAIAANAVLGLVEPTGCGIGGDLFAIVWDEKTNQLYGLNSSGPASKKMSINYVKQQGFEKIPAYGALPVTVPGAVAGWSALHDKFGKLPFENLFNNAIDYANNGFPVTELIAYYLERSSSVFKDYENFSSVWMPSGTTPKKGEIFKNPLLAKTYQAIAKTNGQSFYEGSTAADIIKILNENGNPMSLSDLRNFSPEWVEPVSTNYRGYDVWELPPNGQGIAALQILNILENYDIRKLGFDSAEYIHLFVEAKKLAFEDRAKYYADSNFSSIPTTKLISKEYALERNKLINMNNAAKRFDAGLEDGDTIYLTVADKYGNMVSLIQSNYRGMGSGIVPDNSGFMLQDRGEMFSMDPNHKNSLIGGKRPFHTIIPAFITKDNEPYISFGLMGGAMQPQGHAQIVINIIDFDMNLQEAGDAPRIRHQSNQQPTGGEMADGGEVSLEKGFDYKQIRELMKKGHKVIFDLGSFGGYQAIMIDYINKVYYGASESRKDGSAIGY